MEVPIKEFRWTDDYSFHRTLTCRNHRGMQYVTKNPWNRIMHIVKVDEQVLAQGQLECDCPFADLLVIAPEPAQVGS